MELAEQLKSVGFNTEKMVFLVNGERNKAIGITRLANILIQNGLKAYDIETIESGELFGLGNNVATTLENLKSDNDLLVTITITQCKD